jgi:hypothetical protein
MLWCWVSGLFGFNYSSAFSGSSFLVFPVELLDAEDEDIAERWELH